jgi:hypothetical protein
MQELLSNDSKLQVKDLSVEELKILITDTIKEVKVNTEINLSLYP